MRLTKQYAYGFLASVSEDEKLPMYYELKKVNEILKQVREYVSIIEFIPEETGELQELLGDEFDQQLINFLKVLAQDGLLHRLDTIIEDYQFGLVESNLLLDVNVHSASPLSEEFKEKINQLIEQRWGTSYLLNYKVDSNLLGGLRLEVNNAVIDTTFRSRINQILREV